jgi:hypothetical protein
MADSYHSFEINGLTSAVAQAVVNAINDIDRTGVDIVMEEHNASTGVLKIHIGGAGISTFLSNIRSSVTSRLGRGVDVDNVVPLRDSKVKTGRDRR